MSRTPKPGTVAEFITQHGLGALRGREIQDHDERVVVPDALIDQLLNDYAEDDDPTGRHAWKERLYAVSAADYRAGVSSGCRWLYPNTVDLAVMPLSSVDDLRVSILDAIRCVEEGIKAEALHAGSGRAEQGLQREFEQLKSRLELIFRATQFPGADNSERPSPEECMAAARQRMGAIG